MDALTFISGQFDRQEKLEDRIFSFILVVGTVVVVISTIVTYLEQMGDIATLSTALSGAFMIFIMVLAFVFEYKMISRILLCYVINCVVMPLLFFFCGGIDSGMPLYLLAGLFLIVPILKGKSRVVCMIISLAIDVMTIGLSYNFMEGTKAKTRIYSDLIAKLTLENRIVDVLTSLILVSLFIVVTTGLILSSYQRERDKSEELLIKLDTLSKKDELTGLYNRRELFHHLEEVNICEGGKFYLAMFDIDHFKRVNDTYGHIFGDIALRKVAEKLIECASEDDGELAARYGGEEFILLIKDISYKDALKRIEGIRKEVEKIKWKEDDKLTITISGGFVDCSAYNSMNAVLSVADKRLYEAKDAGRNRIIGEHL